MQRRSFLKKATIGAGAAALAAPSMAQSLPTLNWRLVSSFPKSLDTLFGTPEVFANALRKATDGKFNVKVFAAGEVVPALQVLDAVQNGTVECGHTASYYYLGKNSAFIFDTAAPFGMTARQQAAWMLHGNGMKLMRELYASYNIVNFLGGQTGTQMGGWFRKEIKSPEDLKGLKFRIAGFAGQVLAKLGVAKFTPPWKKAPLMQLNLSVRMMMKSWAWPRLPKITTTLHFGRVLLAYHF
jgi:TRAP-type mannitol/chloroaromatic compound transport system substrate-binding protein